MSLSHSGSIHVVTNDARFSRGFPSSISSSLMICYAAPLGIDCSDIRYLQHDQTHNRSIKSTNASLQSSLCQSWRERGEALAAY
jgi:P pilus assembly chaperone PapD